MLSTRQVAEQLGCTPKVVRQFFRSDDSIANVGSGARYTVDVKDMARIKRRFNEWMGDRALANREDEQPDRPGIPVARLSGKLTSKQRAERDRLTKERVDRLEASLRARGLHVSQMK